MCLCVCVCATVSAWKETPQTIRVRRWFDAVSSSPSCSLSHYRCTYNKPKKQVIILCTNKHGEPKPKKINNKLTHTYTNSACHMYTTAEQRSTEIVYSLVMGGVYFVRVSRTLPLVVARIKFAGARKFMSYSGWGSLNMHLHAHTHRETDRHTLRTSV